jgi:hypothetical protein
VDEVKDIHDKVVAIKPKNKSLEADAFEIRKPKIGSRTDPIS